MIQVCQCCCIPWWDIHQALLILLQRTSCRASFLPGVIWTQPNNRSWQSKFWHFSILFTSTWRTAGVWYLLSLETATPEQIKQSSFTAITQTILWLVATKTKWPTVQKEHQQISQEFRTPFHTLPHLLYYQCQPIHLSLCKQFQRFTHLPDSFDPSSRYSGSVAGNQK